jgi:hypothetical protein
MKGRLTIKRKEKTAKRSERSKANTSAAERRAEKARKARSEKQAENGQPPVPYHQQWQRDHLYLCLARKRHFIAEREMLSSTSLGDLIK